MMQYALLNFENKFIGDGIFSNNLLLAGWWWLWRRINLFLRCLPQHLLACCLPSWVFISGREKDKFPWLIDCFNNQNNQIINCFNNQRKYTRSQTDSIVFNPLREYIKPGIPSTLTRSKMIKQRRKGFFLFF